MLQFSEVVSIAIANNSTLLNKAIDFDLII